MSENYQLSQSPENYTITADQIYQTLINETPSLYPLAKFKTKGITKQLFPDAVKIPNFFNYNLVNPGRVIKKLEGPQSLFKVFYYQLMKVAFQIEVQDKDYIQIIKNIIFSPEFMLEQSPSSPSSGKNYSDLQYKKIVAQFMQLLTNQSIPNFDLTIMSYPVVDEALVKIFQNILKFKSAIEIPLKSSTSSFQVLQTLSEIFQITLMKYDNCFKFQESDIFLYEYTKSEYYIAFLNQMAEMSDLSENSQNCEQDFDSFANVIPQQQQNEQDRSDKQGPQANEFLNRQFTIPTQIKQSLKHQQNKILQENTTDNLYCRNKLLNHSFQSEDEMPNLCFIPNLKPELLKNQQPTNQQFNLSKLSKTVTNSDNAPISDILTSIEKQTQINNHQQVIQSFEVSQQPQMQPSLYESMKKSTSHSPYHLLIAIGEPSPPSQFSYSINNQINDTAKFSKEDDKKQNQQKEKKSKASVNDTKQTIAKLENIQSKQIAKKSNDDQQETIITQQISKYFFVKKEYDSFFSNHQSGKSTYSTRFNQPKLSASQRNQIQAQQLNQTLEKNSIFYSPRPIIPKLPIFEPPKPKSSKVKEFDSFDTLYNQFTNTKVLSLLPEQVQNNIRRMREKYRGIHTSQYYRFSNRQS